MEKTESPFKKTYLISFKRNANLSEVLAVLNSLGLATSSEKHAEEFKQYPGIDIKEVGVLGKR